MSVRVEDPPAPTGAIYACGACGKTSKHRYQFRDSSCWTWAVLVEEASIERNPETGLVVKAKAWKGTGVTP